ncbi:MAG TPA: hypothetical protein VFZ17_11545 [Acidimicrobiia bacterium]|nr:hypothetical protein [Acidimicrobiia bacterium]
MPAAGGAQTRAPEAVTHLGARSPSSVRPFVWASVGGGAVASAVFAWFVFGGRFDLLAPDIPLSGFYEAQARSLLHGHWDASAGAFLFERFKIGGRYYTYFGPWPAILRMPFVLFTHSLDGRLARLSLFVAFVAFLVAVSAVSWSVWRLVRGDARPGRTALVAQAGFVLVVGCGSPVLFLGARAWVYYEACMWAAALTMWSVWFLLRYLSAPTGRDLVGASVTTALALQSRPSIALVGVVGLAVVTGVQLAHRVRARRFTRVIAGFAGVGDDVVARRWWPTAIATATPVVLYLAVGYAKFGSLLGVPFDTQDKLLRIPERPLVLAHTGNSNMGLDYVPTNLLQYLRPDGVRFSALFPWITFAGPARVIGDVPREPTSPTASLVATTVLLVVLAVLGVVLVVRARHAGSPLVVTRLLLLGGVVAFLATATLANAAQRYEVDLMPFLVVAAGAGLWGTRWPPARSTGRRVIVAGLVVLGAWSLAANGALTLTYQRLYSPFTGSGARADFTELQLDVADRLGIDPGLHVRQVDKVPKPSGDEQDVRAPLGHYLVVGDCDSVRIGDGRDWNPLDGADRALCERLLGAASTSSSAG